METVYDKSGNPLVVYPVDARELVQSGEYSRALPETGTSDTAEPQKQRRKRKADNGGEVGNADA